MMTVKDVQHRGAPKLPAAIPSGVEISEAVVKHLSLLSIYLEIETVCSTLFENVLTFDSKGIPHLDVTEAHKESFVSMGVRAVFDSKGWTYALKAG